MQYNLKKALVRTVVALSTLVLFLLITLLSPAWATKAALSVFAAFVVWFIWPRIIDRRRVWVHNHPKPVPPAPVTAATPTPAGVGAPVTAPPAVAPHPTTNLFRFMGWLVGGLIVGLVVSALVALGFGWAFQTTTVPSEFHTPLTIFGIALAVAIPLLGALMGAAKGSK